MDDRRGQSDSCRPAPHTAQAIRQAKRIVLKPLASEGSARSDRKISLAFEEGQTLPTIHERIDALTLDVISEQVISGNPLLPLDRIGDAGGATFKDHRPDPVGRSCCKMERDPSAHRVADEVGAIYA